MSASRNSRPRGKGPGRSRRIVVRSTRRTKPDLHRLARALVDLAAAQAEADAQANTTRAADKEGDSQTAPGQESADE